MNKHFSSECKCTIKIAQFYTSEMRRTVFFLLRSRAAQFIQLLRIVRFCISVVEIAQCEDSANRIKSIQQGGRLNENIIQKKY